MSVKIDDNSRANNNKFVFNINSMIISLTTNIKKSRILDVITLKNYIKIKNNKFI